MIRKISSLRWEIWGGVLIRAGALITANTVFPNLICPMLFFHAINLISKANKIHIHKKNKMKDRSLLYLSHKFRIWLTHIWCLRKLHAESEKSKTCSELLHFSIYSAQIGVLTNDSQTMQTEEWKVHISNATF